jgi:hypothetical protein
VFYGLSALRSPCSRVVHQPAHPQASACFLRQTQPFNGSVHHCTPKCIRCSACVDVPRTLWMAREVMQVPVPSSLWGTLHNSCGWKEFCDGVTSAHVLQQLRDPTTERLKFDVVFTVDWHAALAWQRICEALRHDCSSCRPLWVFLSYRMFSRDEASSQVQPLWLSWAVSSLSISQCPGLLSCTQMIFINHGRVVCMCRRYPAPKGAFNPPCSRQS